MSRCIAFHSYKGGTGKTTIAANLAGVLAKMGKRVFILDLDMYAPGLHTYFGKSPVNDIRNTINDYISGNCEVKDLILDLTPTIKKLDSKESIRGELLGCFSSPERREILKIDGIKEDKNRIAMLRRFIVLTNELFIKHDADYIILDSSPGIRFWAINALAVANDVFLTLKLDDIDIEGTKLIISDILENFREKSNTKYSVLLNRISGYCTPPPNSEPIRISDLDYMHSTKHIHDEILKKLSDDIHIDTISAIPCYCDIQFSQKEFMTAIEHPTHPFSCEFEKLIKVVDSPD
jgi:chromosome partitioning protein